MKNFKKIKLILSCDTKNEIDDQFAIYYALKSPEIDLLGVSSVQNQIKDGENSVDLYHEEAQKLMRLVKSKVPCFRGSRKPIDLKNPEKSAGVRFIIDQVLKSKNKITIASTGPVTDLANAIILEPKILTKANFIWLGGFSSPDEARRFRGREVNFRADKTAANYLLDSTACLIHVPAWGVADNLVTNSHRLSKILRARHLPITQYLADLIDHQWENSQLFHFLFPHRLKRYWVFFDLAAVATAKNFAVKISTKKGQKYQKVTELDAHKILAQFEKYILN